MNSTLFLTGFGIYVLFLIWLGWFVSRNQKSGEDFLLGGRGLPLFLVLGTALLRNSRELNQKVAI